MMSDLIICPLCGFKHHVTGLENLDAVYLDCDNCGELIQEYDVSAFKKRLETIRGVKDFLYACQEEG